MAPTPRHSDSSSSVALFSRAPFRWMEALHALQRLRKAAGHAEGIYLLGTHLSGQHPAQALDMIDDGRLLYIGSSTNLIGRLGPLASALERTSSRLTDHGFAKTYRTEIAQSVGRDELELIVISYQDGCSLENLILSEAASKIGRLPVGNRRRATRPATRPRRQLKRLSWEILSNAVCL